MFDNGRSKWLVAGCLALVLLTFVAGALQYHWIDRVSDADRRQRHDYLAGTLRSFSDDFRETILRPLPFFRARPSAQNTESFESAFLAHTRQWRSVADRPQLLRSICIGTQSDSREGTITFKRLRQQDDQFKEENWPVEFTLYRSIMEKGLPPTGGEPPFFPRGFALELFQGRPVLIFPLITGPAPSMGAPPQSGVPPPGPLPGTRQRLQALRAGTPALSLNAPALKGWCFLEIDTDYLRERLLPELVARHYGPEGRSEYHVAVVVREPLALIYASEAQLTTDSLAEVDGGIVLLDANMMQGRPGLPMPGRPNEGQNPNERRSGPPPPPPPGPQPFVSGTESVPLARLGLGRGGVPEDRAWLLVVKNKAGTLDSLVEHSRRHNLALSFGILILLSGSIVMLMVATARARSLARQQMEFVAGVSHELRTPLTVIHSTSYNLSKGMIHDASRVQQYGAVIQSEARRLINQVERMLSFAGIQSGRRTYDRQPTRVAEIIERALAEYADPLAKEWQVEKQIEDGLPPVLTDAPALESSLKNLFENALKYASQGKWLGVRARAVRHKRTEEVQITIADRGPGIAAKDLPHIFEPFYRGREVTASSIGGAGLGLSLVDRQMRALGGSVTVQSSANTGTSFTLHLPTVTEVDTTTAEGNDGHDR